MFNKEIFLKQEINSSSDDKIYLVKKISDFSVFFRHNKKPLFIVFNAIHEKSDSVRTNLLEMNTHVYINSVENDNSFKSGYCNTVEYMGDLNAGEYFSFVELCELYGRNLTGSNFSEFFYAMLELFQPPVDQSYKNALGLYGELKFLEYIKNSFSADLSNSWHVSGSFSKLDFSFADYGIEVKTTIMENCVAIKHEQLFNDHDNYLATVVCENYDAGECLKDLEPKMIKLFPYFSFAVKLKKELQRIKTYEIENAKFLLKDIHIYEAKKINPFSQIPDAVNFLKYELDLFNESELSESEIKKMLSHG